MITLSRLLCLVLIGLFSFNTAAADKIIMWDKNFEHIELRELVTLAADLTMDEYGAYSLEPSIEMEQGRAFVSLVQNQRVNLVIAAVNQKREVTTLPIYFPIKRGLLGFRLCLVTQQNTELFSNTNTTKDFRSKRLTIGVGSHWPDRKVIEHNNLQTITTPVHSQLFAMLKKGRFDCFLRSIGEIAFEMKKYSTTGIVVEKNLAFVYPIAQFMFVSPSQKRIHSRLQKGLLAAKENGQYQAHFDKYYLQLMKDYNFYNRKLLFLNNPDLSPKALKAINQYGVASFSH
jgi:ABC-type amino acid transport substrate-binding protein